MQLYPYRVLGANWSVRTTHFELHSKSIHTVLDHSDSVRVVRANLKAEREAMCTHLSDKGAAKHIHCWLPTSSVPKKMGPNVEGTALLVAVPNWQQ